MNKKVIRALVVIVVVALVVLAVIYAPNIIQMMIFAHRPPPH